MPESYLTLEEVYNQIKTWNPEQSVPFSEKHVRYNLITFKSAKVQESENVDSVDNWNNLDFSGVKTVTSTAGQICNFLSKFLTSHASSTITNRRRLFKINLNVELKPTPTAWADTKLNPHTELIPIQTGLDQLVSVLVPEDKTQDQPIYSEIEQIGRWIICKCQNRQNIRDLIKVYVVKGNMYSSLTQLQKKYPLYSSEYDEKLFGASNALDYEFIKFCKISNQQFDKLFLHKTAESTKKGVEKVLLSFDSKSDVTIPTTPTLSIPPTIHPIRL